MKWEKENFAWGKGTEKIEEDIDKKFKKDAFFILNCILYESFNIEHRFGSIEFTFVQ